MRHLFLVGITLMVMLTSACSINHKTFFKPADPIINKDPKKLYTSKKYDQALMAMLEADPQQLEDPTQMKLLWNINDRLVTAQWYLQKSIIALMEGQKNTARSYIGSALELYPDHQASLLFEKKIDAIHVEARPINSQSSQKKMVAKKTPSKEDLNQADYYLTKGKVYFKGGQLSMAKASWLKGLDIVPSHKTITKNLVSLITNEGLQVFGQGDIISSIEKWEEALKMSPDDPEIKRYLDKARKAQKKVRSID